MVADIPFLLYMKSLFFSRFRSELTTLLSGNLHHSEPSLCKGKLHVYTR